MQISTKFFNLFTLGVLVLSFTGCNKTTTESEITEKQIAKWSTFEHEDFTFKHPKDWTVTEAENQITLQAPESQGTETVDVKILTFNSFTDLPDNPDGLELRGWLEKKESTYFDGVVGQREIRGEEAYVVYDLGGELGESTFIMVQHDGKIYEINFNVTNSESHPFIRKAMFESFDWTL